MRQILIEKMKAVFGSDQKRIDHALAVLNYAESIMAKEQAQPNIVVAAAVLHDIGILSAEQKYHSAAGIYQELEGPPIAKAILESLAFPPADINHICAIVGSHHSGGKIDTPEFRCVWDADWIVNLGDDYASWTQAQKQKIIDSQLRTHAGRRIACRLYLSKNMGKQ
ncbi:MAG TPA: HD domain-containing protein [Anaerohalosphaeraceae bacterium]|nr:HD domain-containing protein [Phycisphaerae bacterium]HOK94486.1 HD domain-containing protein [Anaerohalosphaeraceae bacterium]HOL30476.1 HD domain-containing protein [Anaerohalosphaeraceae bacterium]HOM76342.1 HD domain-containing protein [Anaerohalosphaeraceae bacterium]HPC63287.1 HD domain-containing protein [Anaerohalosphaeraceae bacterium]